MASYQPISSPTAAPKDEQTPRERGNVIGMGLGRPSRTVEGVNVAVHCKSRNFPKFANAHGSNLGSRPLLLYLETTSTIPIITNHNPNLYNVLFKHPTCFPESGSHVSLNQQNPVTP